MAFSEDCLTINVFRPSGLKSNAKLPVVSCPFSRPFSSSNKLSFQLFWTYGGGFDAGASSLYNGSGIVGQSVARVCCLYLSASRRLVDLSFKGTPLIYVNFNYRLGPLGFPQGQEGLSYRIHEHAPAYSYRSG